MMTACQVPFFFFSSFFSQNTFVHYPLKWVSEWPFDVSVWHWFLHLGQVSSGSETVLHHARPQQHGNPLCLSVCFFLCLPVFCLSTYMSVCPSVCLFEHPSAFCLSACLLSIYLPVCLPAHQSAYLNIPLHFSCLSACFLSTYLSVCLFFVCLPTYLFACPAWAPLCVLLVCLPFFFGGGLSTYLSVCLPCLNNRLPFAHLSACFSSVYLPVCLPISLTLNIPVHFACLSASFFSVYLPVCLPALLEHRSAFCLSVCLPVFCLSTYLYACFFVCLPTCLFACPSVFLL